MCRFFKTFLILGLLLQPGLSQAEAPRMTTQLFRECGVNSVYSMNGVNMYEIRFCRIKPPVLRSSGVRGLVCLFSVGGGKMAGAVLTRMWCEKETFYDNE